MGTLDTDCPSNRQHVELPYVLAPHLVVAYLRSCVIARWAALAPCFWIAKTATRPMAFATFKFWAFSMHDGVVREI